MVMARKPGKATYDDLLALPDHVIGELIEGELLASPRPAPPHQLVANELSRDLTTRFGRGGEGGPGGWWIFYEVELHLGKNVLVPDLAGWRKERMPSVPKTPAIELVPDWVCEIISPSSVRIDRAKKPSVYARAQVPWFWVIDPLARTLEVFQLRDGLYSLSATHTENERVRAEPFAVVELDMSFWWTGAD